MPCLYLFKILNARLPPGQAASLPFCFGSACQLMRQKPEARSEMFVVRGMPLDPSIKGGRAYVALCEVQLLCAGVL